MPDPARLTDQQNKPDFDMDADWLPGIDYPESVCEDTLRAERAEVKRLRDALDEEKADE